MRALERITLLLERYLAKSIADPVLVSAAILLPFYHRDGEAHLLLTRRTEQVLRHKGQIAFPGGTREPGDADLYETALREGEEEIGLLRAHVRAIGRLDDYRTLSGYCISPFVVEIPHPYPYVLCPKEIAALVEVPWHFFLESGECIEYLYGPNRIWGATAGIIRGLVRLVQTA